MKDITSDTARRVVLITGGAGFLGSHLCERYLERGWRVLCLDNLSTGRLSNIAALMARPNFSFIRHDITEPFAPLGPVDLIYNMACPASPSKYRLDPVKTFRTSVLGAMHMLDLAVAKGARILQASTSEVYGDPEISPQPESYRGSVSSFGPRSCYDEGKRGAETLFHDYRDTRGADIRVARIFNTYGPNMDPEDGRVVSNFVTQVLRGEPLTIYGDGSQTRSFCYVDDLIEGLLALMHGPADLDRPVNLGNPGEFTVAELADLVEEIAGRHVGRKTVELPGDDPRKRRPDISLAKERLGWEPRVQLREGLERAIPYFEAELDRAGQLSGSMKVAT